MKKCFLPLFFAVALTGIAATAFADDKPSNYIVFKGGVYSPSKSYDISNFNNGNTSHLDSKTGFDGEFGIGHYIMPMLAIELGSGYFESKATPASELGEIKLKVIPVLATAKVVLPMGPIEPYGEAGVGAYFTKLVANSNLGTFSDSSKTTYGFHAGAGLNINITQSAFIGVEGRYLWATSTFGGQDVKLDGFTATADLGFRF